MAEYKLTEAQMEQISKLADKCENYVSASRLPVSATIHVPQLRNGFQEIASELRAIYIAATGYNPWGEEK